MAPEKGANPASGIIALRGPLSPARSRAVCESVEQLLLDIGCCQIVCQVSGTADLSVVDALARLALITQRAHASLRIEASGEASQSLSELAAFTGLECLDQQRIQELERRWQAKTRE